MTASLEIGEVRSETAPSMKSRMPSCHTATWMRKFRRQQRFTGPIMTKKDYNCIQPV